MEMRVKARNVVNTRGARTIASWCLFLAHLAVGLLLATHAGASASNVASSYSSSTSAQPKSPYPVFNAPPYFGGSGGGSGAGGRPSPSSLLEEVLSPDSTGDICRPKGQIEDACCDYETVEKTLNTPRFYQTLVDLVKTNYFRYYRVDLFKDCPYWVENGLCMNRACGVEKASEAEVPEEYRSNRLSSVSTADTSEIVFPGDGGEAQLGLGHAGDPGTPASLTGAAQCRDSDFCHWEEEERSSEAAWVDLIKNPERFTGYAGTSANRVWKAIYEENCFGAVPKGSFIEPPRAKTSGGGTGFVGKSDLLGSSSSGGPSFNGLSGLMPSLAAPADPASTEQCLEKRVFYRVISGLHASISMHVCHEYLNQTTGEWSPNLECFISRIAQHPERLQNVYFNYVLLVRALAKAGDYLTNFNLKPGHAIPASETQTTKLLESLVSQANSCPPTFDEASMFKLSNPEAPKLKAEFRDHFRNISTIMDCVGCDKCRLWGKMQVNGLGTAMKILFSFDDSDFDPAKNPALLERSELVALINTLHRFAESLKAVETFREMYQTEVAAKKEELGLTKKKSPTQQRRTSADPAPAATSSLSSESRLRNASASSTTTTATTTSSAADEPFSAEDESLLSAYANKLSSAVHHLLDGCGRSLSTCVDWVRGAYEGLSAGRSTHRSSPREL